MTRTKKVRTGMERVKMEMEMGGKAVALMREVVRARMRKSQRN